MRTKPFLQLILLPTVALYSASVGWSAQTPTLLTCTSNAKADRDYGYSEKQWMAQGGGKPIDIFRIGTPPNPNGAILREKVFSGLNTSRPVIRSITPAVAGGDGIADEFGGTVVNRAGDSIWITWRNPPGNKIWLAVIHLVHKKAVVTQLFEGTTSVGGELETLDCR